MFPSGTLDQVDKGEDHDPHQIDKMPVETSNLDRVVIIGGIRTTHASEQDAEQVNHATRDVHAMETSNDEKGRAEQRRPIGIAREPQTFMENELVPLIGLAAQKDHATEDRQANELAKRRIIVALDRCQALDHPDTTDDQQKGHASRQPDAQDIIGLWPVSTAIPYATISSQERAKRHGITYQEDPHPEFAPALGGQRAFV